VALARKRNALAKALRTKIGPEIYNGLEGLCGDGEGDL
jgi:hypothetical protein